MERSGGVKTPFYVKLLIVAFLVNSTAPAWATSGKDDHHASASTGEVQLTGTLLQSENDPDYPASNSADGNFATFWKAKNATTGWIGMDAGVAVEPTRFRWAPRGDAISAPPVTAPGYPDIYEARSWGSQLQSSASALFTSPSSLGNLAAFPYAPRNEFSELLITGSANRYLRVLNTSPLSYGGNFAEVRWFAKAGTAAEARPVPPVIAPYGGNFPNQTTVTVSMSSLTTSASIYYTTDGSSPSILSTLYTGPFSLSIGDSTTLRAVASDVTLSTPLSEEPLAAVFHNYGWKPATNFSDNQGCRVDAFGGNLFDNTSRDGYYYLVGAPTEQANKLNTHDTWGNRGVNMYRSPNALSPWEKIGNILPNVDNGSSWTERPRVIYNPNTDKYIISARSIGPNRTPNLWSVAEASSIIGPWAWVATSMDPNGVEFCDANIYQDESGKGYIVFTNYAQNSSTFMALTSDYHRVTGQASVYSFGNREAPVVLKVGAVWFWISSVGNYYDSESTFDINYRTANSPMGPWSSPTDLFTPDSIATAYNGQSSFLLKVPGRAGYIYGSDHWDKTALAASTFTWLPVTFPTSTKMVITQPSFWDVSIFPATDTPSSAQQSAIGAE